MQRLDTKKFRKDLFLVGMYDIICSASKPGTPDVAPGKHALLAYSIQYDPLFPVEMNHPKQHFSS
jgi:hypothetical protein